VDIRENEATQPAGELPGFIFKTVALEGKVVEEVGVNPNRSLPVRARFDVLLCVLFRPLRGIEVARVQAYSSLRI
jgi:hypothetical protein